MKDKSIPEPMTRAEYDELIPEDAIQEIIDLVGDDPAALEFELQDEYEIYLEEYRRNFCDIDEL